MFDINKTMLFCWQTFNWHNIWLKELLPCHLFLFYKHLANAIFGWNSYYHVIRLKDIWLTQCLVDTDMTIPFGWQTFEWHNIRLTQVSQCHLVGLCSSQHPIGWHTYNMLRRRNVFRTNGFLTKAMDGTSTIGRTSWADLFKQRERQIHFPLQILSPEPEPEHLHYRTYQLSNIKLAHFAKKKY